MSCPSFRCCCCCGAEGGIVVCMWLTLTDRQRDWECVQLECQMGIQMSCNRYTNQPEEGVTRDVSIVMQYLLYMGNSICLQVEGNWEVSLITMEADGQCQQQCPTCLFVELMDPFAHKYPAHLLLPWNPSSSHSLICWLNDLSDDKLWGSN